MSGLSLVASTSPFFTTKNLTPAQEAADAKLQALDDQINSVLHRLQQCDLRQIPYSESLQVRRAIDACRKAFRALQEDKDTIPNCEALKNKMDTLKAKLTSAKVGGLISPIFFSSKVFKEYSQFITTNNLDNKMQALRLQLGRGKEGMRGPLVPIAQPDGSMVEIEWYKLRKTKALNEEGKQTGWIFYYEGKEVFRTDMDFKLGLEYHLLHNGINQYNARTVLDLPVFDRRDPKEWGEKYVIELHMTVQNKDGRTPSPFLGDHSFILLKDKEGNVRSIGMYGPPAETFTAADQKNLFGIKAGQYWTPDDYLYFPLDKGNTQVLTVETDDKAIYDRVFQHLIEQKKDSRPLFSFLKNNCTTHAAGVMRDTLGIEADAKMPFASYLARQIFPIAWQKAFAKCYDASFGKLPQWLQNGLCFTPLYYLPTLVIGLIVKSYMLYNNKGFEDKPADISWFDLFFRPWNMYGDHPITLRESIAQKYPSGKLQARLDSQGRVQLKALSA